jgi:hypothetical protein
VIACPTEQAHVFHRDHCLVGKGLQQRDFFLGERSLGLSRYGKRPDALTFPYQRNLQTGADAVGLGDEPFELDDVVGFPVRDVHDLSIEHHLRREVLSTVERCRAHLGGQDVQAGHRVGGQVKVGFTPQKEYCRFCRHEALRALHDRLEDRLRVGRRPGDDAQDLARRGLPLERLLGLIEQAHVLDRDNRLARERAYQVDLLLGEWPDFGAANGDAADDLSLFEHGHCEVGSRSAQFHRSDGSGITFAVGGELPIVGDVDRSLLGNHECQRGARARLE